MSTQKNRALSISYFSTLNKHYHKELPDLSMAGTAFCVDGCWFRGKLPTTESVRNVVPTICDCLKGGLNTKVS